MADYYVDSASGNDTTGDGSSGNPWATIQKAIDNATGGDTIHLSNVQKFTEGDLSWSSGFGTTTYNTPLVFTSWDNGGSIAINHPNGGTIVAAEIDGEDTQIRLFSNTSKPNYVIVKNLIVHNMTQFGINLQSFSTIYQCEAYAIATNRALECGAQSKIIGSYVHSIPSGAQGIRAGDRSHIIANYVEANNDSAIVADDLNYVANNIIYGASVIGIEFTGSDVSIINNTIIGDDSTAGASGIEDSAGNNDLGVISGNHIQDFSGSGSYGINLNSGTSVVLIGPNSFYNNDTNTTVGSVIAVDLTSNDVTASSEPLTDKANGDFRVKSDSDIKSGNYLFEGTIGTSFTQTVAFGAAQAISSGGSGSSGPRKHSLGR